MLMRGARLQVRRIGSVGTGGDQRWRHLNAMDGWVTYFAECLPWARLGLGRGWGAKGDRRQLWPSRSTGAYVVDAGLFS